MTKIQVSVIAVKAGESRNNKLEALAKSVKALSSQLASLQSLNLCVSLVLFSVFASLCVLFCVFDGWCFHGLMMGIIQLLATAGVGVCFWRCVWTKAYGERAIVAMISILKEEPTAQDYGHQLIPCHDKSLKGLRCILEYELKLLWQCSIQYTGILVLLNTMVICSLNFNQVCFLTTPLVVYFVSSSFVVVLACHWFRNVIYKESTCLQVTLSVLEDLKKEFEKSAPKSEKLKDLGETKIEIEPEGQSSV